MGGGEKREVGGWGGGCYPKSIRAREGESLKRAQTEERVRKKAKEGRGKEGEKERGEKERERRGESARAEESRAPAATAARRSAPSETPRRLLRAAGGAGPFGNRIANVI